MPPIVAGAAIAGAATIGGSVIGGIAANNASKRASRDAAAQRQRVEDLYMQVEVPKIADQMIQLQEIAKVRELTPAEEQLFQQGQTALSKIQTDPRLKNAQMRALSSLQEIEKQGGLTAEDKMKVAQVQQQVGKAARGAREAIMQRASASGTSGGGAQLAAQLSAEQGAADTAAMEGMSTAAGAQQRGLQAIIQGAELAGKTRSQEYGEQAEAAKSQDIINRFNTGLGQDWATRKAQREMGADQFNIENEMKRDIMNTQWKNYQEQYNKGLVQQKFENEMAKTKGATSQAGEAAAATERAGAREAGMWGGIGQAIGGVGSSIGSFVAGGSASTPSATATAQDYSDIQKKMKTENWGENS